MVTTLLYYAFGTTSKGIKKAGRLSIASASDSAGKNLAAERQEAEGDGANDKLGFSAMLLTMQHMAKTMPH